MSDEGSKKQQILRKVQALLAQADGTPFTEEADTFRQKADELMTLYAIEEFELAQVDGSKPREKPEKRRVFCASANSDIREPLADLAANLARHCRCMIVYHGYNYKNSDLYVSVVGFPSDLDFFELLLTSMHLKIASDLEPKYDPALSEGANVRRMKEAGMKWARICQLVPGMERAFREDGSVGPEAIRVYKAQCKKDGVEPMKTMPSTYLYNFAAGFVTEITQRLRDMRRQTESNLTSTGHDLVLFKTRDEEVTEAYHEFFPKLKSHAVATTRRFNGAARQAGAKSGATADLSGGRNNVSGSRGALNR